MVAYLDVLCLGMIHWVLHNANCAFIINVDFGIHEIEAIVQSKDQGPTSGIRANRGTLMMMKLQTKEDASDTGAAPKQQQQVIPQTTAISNIKLPILKKEEYDIWAMEMEHYLEYIDNDVWKVIQNGNSKKRISTGKDGVIRILPPVTAAEIQAVEKERKAKNILLKPFPRKKRRTYEKIAWNG
ncbi:hypothetical protein Tco_1011351 [Tanacetum coccineum]